MDAEKYNSGEDRYVNFAEDFLGVRLSHVQKKILRTVATNQRTLIWSGNGPGKSFSISGLKLGFLMTNPNSLVLGTSGSYGQYHDTMWRPLENMFEEAQKNHDLPGRIIGGNQPRLEIDNEWYAKVVSPRSPKELEGRHGPDVLVVIDEADKPYVTSQHFDSGGSSITDTNDKMVAICNPPEDETNVVEKIRNSDRWKVIQFSSFESHNVQVDAGEIDDTFIPGLVDLPTLADDWEAWNNEPWPLVTSEYPGDWPGMYQIINMLDEGDLTREEVCGWLRPGFPIAKEAAEIREDLDKRWYIRRAGMMPPDSSTSYRPWSVANVEDSLNPYYDFGKLRGLGYDVARMGGDWNVLCGYDGTAVTVLDRWKGVDHNVNFDLVNEYIRPNPQASVVVDAQGEGSALADRLQQHYPRVVRFNAGSKATDEAKFYSKWDEGLYELGQMLKGDGIVIPGEKIGEELKATARTVAFVEKYYASRNDEVLKADPKDDVKDLLGRSPDVLDAAYMAVWGATSSGKQRLVW